MPREGDREFAPGDLVRIRRYLVGGVLTSPDYNELYMDEGSVDGAATECGVLYSKDIALVVGVATRTDMEGDTYEDLYIVAGNGSAGWTYPDNVEKVVPTFDEKVVLK